MNEELNSKLGYNRELLEQLSNAFDLQEDYNDYGWDKLFEICRYIYNLEQQVKTQQLMINKAINLLNTYIGVLDDTSDLYFENVKSILELEVKKEK